jgi:hypothetical protein
MDAKKSVRISGLASTTLLILATTLAVGSDLLNLFSRFHFLPLVIAFVGSAGLIASFLMWRSYRAAIHEAEAGGSRDLVLGGPRIDLAGRESMVQSV